MISTADDLWTSFSGAFLSAFLCAVMVSLYHERREDIRPRRERGKLTWRNVTFRAAVLLGTLLLVTLFSETEVGGWRRYTPEQATEVVAHRAGAGFAPENTVSALKQAAEDEMCIRDSSKSRFGRYRCWLLRMPPVVAACLVLNFTVPNFGPTGNIIYAAITYIIMGMAFTSVDIPYWSLPAAMTSDPEERTKIFTTATPVSYTHLDVYKRQPLSWSFS